MKESKNKNAIRVNKTNGDEPNYTNIIQPKECVMKKIENEKIKSIKQGPSRGAAPHHEQPSGTSLKNEQHTKNYFKREARDTTPGRAGLRSNPSRGAEPLSKEPTISNFFRGGGAPINVLSASQ